MKRVIVTAAVMLLGVGVAMSTAKADMNVGPLVDAAKGLCYKLSPNSEAGFGYWTACPKPVAAPVARHRRHARRG